MPEWTNDNIPKSTRFDDTYYSIHDGRAETQHVYINGNNLTTRWKETNDFTIAELGFGTGLNFLETYRQWKKNRTPKSHMKYISFEQYPLDSTSIRRALSAWPQLDSIAHKFCEIWDNTGEQFNLKFDDDCELTVIFGDANARLNNSKFLANAWYLDGYSPSKNPQLWNETLMQQVYNKTAQSGTIATYSVAGFVRRNLQGAGFEIMRARGFATKREMLKGIKL